MSEKLPVLQVRLLGKERITYGNTTVLYGRSSITKGMKLLLLLLYNGEKGVNRNKLLEDLYENEDLADAANNLRVTIHRLKKMLVDAGLPEYEYIFYKGGVYYWNSPMETVTDTEVFCRLLKEAEETEDSRKKLALLKEACELYGGDFLQRLAGMEWVLTECVRFKGMYEKALQEVCSILMDEGRFEETLELVEPACNMYPFDEWQVVKIDCYIGMHRYQEALKEYEDTAKKLIEELGVSPSEKMLERFRTMNQHISHRPQIIAEIKEGLNDEEAKKGALFCAYPSFRDAYRIVQRGMERSGQSVFLLLCTLVDSKGQPMKNSAKLDEMANGLHQAIRNSLRKSDSFTKYNNSQFLVMLVGTNKENCQVVINRIINEFTKEHKSWNKYIECSVTSLLDEEEGK